MSPLKHALKELQRGTSEMGGMEPGHHGILDDDLNSTACQSTEEDPTQASCQSTDDPAAEHPHGTSGSPITGSAQVGHAKGLTLDLQREIRVLSPPGLQAWPASPGNVPTFGMPAKQREDPARCATAPRQRALHSPLGAQHERLIIGGPGTTQSWNGSDEASSHPICDTADSLARSPSCITRVVRTASTPSMKQGMSLLGTTSGFCDRASIVVRSEGHAHGAVAHQGTARVERSIGSRAAAAEVSLDFPSCEGHGRAATPRQGTSPKGLAVSTAVEGLPLSFRGVHAEFAGTSRPQSPIERLKGGSSFDTLERAMRELQRAKTSATFA